MNSKIADSQARLPACKYSFVQRNLKGEDTAVSADKELSGTSCHQKISIHALFDGHNGSSTARYCQRHLVDEILQRYPQTNVPDTADEKGVQAYLSAIREAVAGAFDALNRGSIAANCNSGCTASVIIVAGWLVTAANVGDSDIMVQSELDARIVSRSHRVGGNHSELERLRAAGCTVAQLASDLKGPATDGDGIGPMRVWPGGLCVSRAIGDVDVGPSVLDTPHITQFCVPKSGARIVLASDGVWEGLSVKKASEVMRSKPLQDCGKEMVRHALMKSGLNDDTTVTVVDILPATTADFCTLNPVASKMGSLFCTAQPDVARDGVEVLEILSEVDMVNPQDDLAVELSVQKLGSKMGSSCKVSARRCDSITAGTSFR